MKISKVVVLGSGTMGSGIAAQVANAGLQVHLLDLTKDIASSACERIKKSRPPLLIDKTKIGYDVVHISRFGKNSISDDANWLDRFGNNMFTFLVNSFFGGNYTDALNGFRIIKRSSDSTT